MIDKEALLKSLEGKTYLRASDFIESINSGAYDSKIEHEDAQYVAPQEIIDGKQTMINSLVFECIDNQKLIESKLIKMEGLIKSADSFLSESKSKISYLEKKLLEKNEYFSEQHTLISFLKAIFPNHEELLKKIYQRQSCPNCPCQECA